MMKILLLSIAGLLFLTASSQTNLVLHFDQNVGENPLVLNEEYTHPEEGFNFSITRLQYYISEIEITHDGGQITAIEDTWLLVDAAEQSDFELGSYNISNVEGISFWIGVDEPHNHLDPTKISRGTSIGTSEP